jgi:hypothetical protein
MPTANAALEHADGAVVSPTLAESEADADAEILDEPVHFLAGRRIGTDRFSSSAAPYGSNRAVGYRVDNGALEIAWAALGDANLDSELNAFDLGALQSGGKFSRDTPATWQDGDTNYDGRFNIFDLVAMNGTGLFGRGSYLPQEPAPAAAKPLDPMWVFAALAAEDDDEEARSDATEPSKAWQAPRIAEGIPASVAALFPSTLYAAGRLKASSRSADHFRRQCPRLTPFPNPDPDLVRESSCPGWGWKGFSEEEATQCRADRGLASAG